MKLSDCKTLEQLNQFKLNVSVFVDEQGQKYQATKVAFVVEQNGFDWMEFQTFGGSWVRRDLELYNNSKDQQMGLWQKMVDNCRGQIERLKEELDRETKLKNRALYELAKLGGRPEQELERFTTNMEPGEISEEKIKSYAFRLIL